MFLQIIFFSDHLPCQGNNLNNKSVYILDMITITEKVYLAQLFAKILKRYHRKFELQGFCFAFEDIYIQFMLHI